MRNNKVVVEQVLKSYKENQIGQNSDWFVDYSEGRVNNFIEQLARYRKILPPPHSSSEVTILDIGAAPFVCAEALVALGYRVSAVDLNPDRFENIDKLRCQVVKGNGETPKSLDLNNASFDVVILSHVIEHFRHNLIETLSDIKLLLKPRGCLIIDTPNLLSVKGLYSIFNRGVAYSCAGSLYHEWSKITTLGHMGHVREYTAAEMYDLLSGVGFSVESISYHGVINPKNVKSRLINLFQQVFKKLKLNLQVIGSI